MITLIAPLIAPEEVTRYIPHRPPFVLVDALYECTDERAVTGFYVSADHVLVRRGYLQASGLLENMAQSFALQSAYQGTQAPGLDRPFSMGFIAGIKGFQMRALVPVGQEISTEMRKVQSFGNMFLVAGEVRCRGQLVASCQLQLIHE
jgi:predicted hotdog family 3-hydroxylacyl-ACP dehydratase